MIIQHNLAITLHIIVITVLRSGSSWGHRNPSGCPGAESLVEGQGAKPPKAGEFFVFKTLIINTFAGSFH